MTLGMMNADAGNDVTPGPADYATHNIPDNR